MKAGILDERPASDVTDAVLADPTLTERQKQVLLDIYQSFRQESGRTPTPATPPNDPTRSDHHGRVAADRRGRPQGP